MTTLEKNFLAILKLTAKKKLREFKVRKNIKIRAILIKLLSLNILLKLTETDFYFYCTLNYNNKNEFFLKNINIYNRIRHKNIFKKKIIKKWIKKDNSFNSIYLLKTNKGIVTHLEAMQIDIGGKIICKIQV